MQNKTQTHTRNNSNKNAECLPVVSIRIEKLKIANLFHSFDTMGCMIWNCISSDFFQWFKSIPSLLAPFHSNDWQRRTKFQIVNSTRWKSEAEFKKNVQIKIHHFGSVNGTISDPKINIDGLIWIIMHNCLQQRERIMRLSPFEPKSISMLVTYYYVNYYSMLFVSWIGETRCLISNAFMQMSISFRCIQF